MADLRARSDSQSPRQTRHLHWYAVIELGRDATGKRQQDIIRKDPQTGLPILTKKRALEIEREELVKRHRGNIIDPDVTPFGAFLERWLEETRSSRADSTNYHWASVVRRHVSPALGTIPLGKLTTIDIERLYRTYCEQGYSFDSANNLRVVVNGALKAAVRWKLIAINPAQGAMMPKAKKRKPRLIWTADETRAFLAATASSEWHALWRLLLDSAIRIGEARALTWQDLDSRAPHGAHLAHGFRRRARLGRDYGPYQERKWPTGHYPYAGHHRGATRL
jgi:hypothetical protein